MRFLVMVRASRDSEAGVAACPDLVADMLQYNEELVKAGVIDGPFPETKELIAEIEIRRVFETDEFAEFTPEQREKERRLRAQVAAGHS